MTPENLARFVFGDEEPDLSATYIRYLGTLTERGSNLELVRFDHPPRIEHLA